MSGERFTRVPERVTRALRRGDLSFDQHGVLVALLGVTDWRTDEAVFTLRGLAEAIRWERSLELLRRILHDLAQDDWIRIETPKPGSSKPWVITLTGALVGADLQGDLHASSTPEGAESWSTGGGDLHASSNGSDASDAESGSVDGIADAASSTEAPRDGGPLDVDLDVDLDVVPVDSAANGRVHDRELLEILEQARDLVDGDEGFVFICLKLFADHPRLTREDAQLVLGQFDAISHRREGDGRGTFQDYDNLPGAFYERLHALAWTGSTP